MDIKVFLHFLLVLITIALQKTTATTPGIKLSITDDKNGRDKTTATCSVKMDELVTSSTATSQEENDTNDISDLDDIVGPKGFKGETGLRGPPGYPGVIENDEFMQGFVGVAGIKNIGGDVELRELAGLPGQKGDPGMDFASPNGDQGVQGLPGYPGLAGPNGRCDCDSDENPLKFGREDAPAKVTCKNAPSGVPSGTYYIGPPGAAISVYCKMETKETCIRTRINNKAYFSFGEGNWWLTSKTGDVAYHFYNGLTREQIKWLQQRSTRVRQRLTYICYTQRDQNFNLSSAVVFLSWNDMEIGHKPTSDYPFSYSVLPSSDGCLIRDRHEASSIIELETSNVFRLPIRDMWVEDVGDPEESFMVRNIELCFG